MRQFLCILCLSLHVLGAEEACLQSLNFIVEETIRSNPFAQISHSEVRQAEAALLAAFGEFLPIIDGMAMAGREGTQSPSPDVPLYLDATEARISLIQPLFTGFSSYHGVWSRKFSLDSGKFQREFTLESLASQTASTYLTVLLTREERVLAEKNVQDHQEILEKIEKRFSGGAGDKAEVDLARARLNEAKEALIGIERAEENANAAFLRIVGFEARDLFLPVPVSVPENLDEAQNVAKKSSPVLLAAEANLRANIEAVGVAKARFYPQINLEFTADSQSNLGGQVGREKTARGMIVARYNFFRGFQDEANLRQAEELALQSRLNRDEVCREITENVTNIWYALKANQLLVEELLQRSASTKAVLEGYVQQFTLGRRSLLNVLDMRRELFRAEIDLLQSEYAVRIGSYNLLANLGVLRESLFCYYPD